MNPSYLWIAALAYQVALGDRIVTYTYPDSTCTGVPSTGYIGNFSICEYANSTSLHAFRAASTCVNKGLYAAQYTCINGTASRFQTWWLQSTCLNSPSATGIDTYGTSCPGNQQLQKCVPAGTMAWPQTAEDQVVAVQYAGTTTCSSVDAIAAVTTMYSMLEMACYSISATV
jgi:hypothetical protein